MQTMVSTAGAALAKPVASAQPAESDELEAGAKAGPWVVERELGRGGMGSVYAVVHEDIGKRAALKVMHRRLITSSSVERILLEARVVNQVGHPNIVDIFETGTLADGRPYIVMERLEGMPLSYRADEGKILPDQVIGILLQVCDALIAAHAANVVHRDLKLDNVFLLDNADDPSQPRVKLLDWGIAKIISNDEVRHTIEGQLVGTPQYLSPEQARGAAVTPQTDVYSLGVMAYELFLEQLPFEAETSAEIMAMHLRATPPPPSEMWPDIPASLENLLLAMLAKDADARPTMLTVAHTLELIRSEMQSRRITGRMPSEHKTATIAPEPHERRSAPRLASVPEGFAPTEPASEWVEPKRRWHVVVGAFAIATSAALFLVTRQTEQAEASAARAEATRAEHVSPVVRGTVQDSLAELPDNAKQVANNEPVLDSAMPLGAIAAPAFASTTKPAKKTRVMRKAQVKPHLDSPVDPDGTLDPYR
jgi:tRNA A-37 threonylcarbamoyl transferase component Bud32